MSDPSPPPFNGPYKPLQDEGVNWRMIAVVVVMGLVAAALVMLFGGRPVLL